MTLFSHRDHHRLATACVDRHWAAHLPHSSLRRSSHVAESNEIKKFAVGCGGVGRVARTSAVPTHSTARNAFTAVHIISKWDLRGTFARNMCALRDSIRSFACVCVSMTKRPRVHCAERPRCSLVMRVKTQSLHSSLQVAHSVLTQ